MLRFFAALFKVHCLLSSFALSLTSTFNAIKSHDLPAKSVGIDLGTTNSAIAVVIDGKPVIVNNSKGKSTTPSVVAWQRKNDFVVGENALNSVDDAVVFSGIKRLIGSSLSKLKKSGLKLNAMGVDLRQEGPVQLKTNSEVSLTPEDISSKIIESLIADSEKFLKNKAKVTRAVIGVPAYFNEEQCLATEKAGLKGGLEKVKIMREPEAAALAYGLTKNEDELVLVFDLGGGTFDVSVLLVGRGVVEVIATSGNPQLGGDDFDNCIASWIIDEIIKSGGPDPRMSSKTYKILIKKAEQARINLSNQTETSIALNDEAIGSNLELKLSRSKMEAICAEPLKNILQPIREVALMANICLEGETGQTPETENLRVSNINLLKHLKFTSLCKQEMDDNDEPYSSIRQSKKGRNISRKTSKSKRMQSTEFTKVKKEVKGKLHNFPTGQKLDQVIMVGGATRMLCVRNLVESMTGIAPKITVNPDEAVALGAAIYAGIIDGEIKDMDVMTAWQAAVMRTMALEKNIK